ncbi:MAG: glycosyltransferase, partial [Pyrinomonadaceae bacterium]|nr:glycosyltransferase [Pyrinomonadaceae bacterium]
MTTPDLVSVIIPCYKQAHFLGAAIESALAQSYAPVEIVVVDDGSPDNTSEVAARYPQVRCIRQENQGSSAARNTGIRESNGSFLVFLDADDKLLPHALETHLKCFQAHADCVLVSGHYQMIAGDGSPLQTPAQPHVTGEHYARLLHSNYIGCPAIAMYRRAAFNAVGDFNTSLRAAEDYEMYLRVARKFPLYSHTEIVAEHRRHESNTSDNLALMEEYSVGVLRAEWEYVRGDKRLERAYRSGLRFKTRMYRREMLVEKLRQQARAGHWTQALPSMFKLLGNYPLAFAAHAGKILRNSVLRNQ